MMVKNNKETSDIWVGMTIEPSEYYSIQRAELPRWQSDSKVITDIASGDLIVNDGDADMADVAEAVNYLLQAEIKEVDSSGRSIVKTAAAQAGATYLANFCEITTSLEVISETWNGGAGDYSAKFYDSSNNELSSGDTNCVKTVVTFAPSINYEVIAGKIHLSESPATDVNLWVIGGATDLSAYPGTVVEMVRNCNLRYVQSSLISDGRAAKYLNYTTAGVPYPTNKLQFIIKHDAGVQFSFIVSVEMFR